MVRSIGEANDFWAEDNQQGIRSSVRCRSFLWPSWLASLWLGRSPGGGFGIRDGERGSIGVTFHLCAEVRGHRRNVGGVGAVGREVGQFQRIGGEVEELRAVDLGIADEFPAVVAHRALHVSVAGVEDVADFRGAAVDDRREAAGFEAVRDFFSPAKSQNVENKSIK